MNNSNRKTSIVIFGSGGQVFIKMNQTTIKVITIVLLPHVYFLYEFRISLYIVNLVKAQRIDQTQFPVTKPNSILLERQTESLVLVYKSSSSLGCRATPPTANICRCTLVSVILLGYRITFEFDLDFFLSLSTG